MRRCGRGCGGAGGGGGGDSTSVEESLFSRTPLPCGVRQVAKEESGAESAGGGIDAQCGGYVDGRRTILVPCHAVVGGAAAHVREHRNCKRRFRHRACRQGLVPGKDCSPYHPRHLEPSSLE